MNERFYLLSPEKQNRIVNAGFRVFSESPYKKAPVSEIAQASNISKALLFHYFHNKQELYLFLWQRCIEITQKRLAESKTLETSDLFEMIRRSMHAKCGMMRDFPYLNAFSLRAYYETDPAVCDAIRQDFEQQSRLSEAKMLEHLDRSCLKPGIDLHFLYQEIVWASDGYVHTALAAGPVDPDRMEQDFSRLIDFWQANYAR